MSPLQPNAILADGTINASSLRRNNLLQLLGALRQGTAWSRAELATETGLAVQSVHRLVDELSALDLVAPSGESESPQRRGRPTVRFRFRDERALLAGVDVGSETTRVAMTSLTGVTVATAQLPTVELHGDLSGGLQNVLRDLLTVHAHGRPLVAAGVGVPSVVDDTGSLVQPWLAHRWSGTPLRSALESEFGCRFDVRQDNHLSALAENSERGTCPDAELLVVVEVGIGVGAGMTIDRRLVTGAHGRLGRLMRWPAALPAKYSSIGTTLGESLVADGLVRQYQLRGGARRVFTGAELFTAALSGDEHATAVLEWAASTLRTVLQQIALFADPDAIVVGGGIGRGLLTAPATRSILAELDMPTRVLPSALGTDAVVIGGVLAAMQHVDAWLLAQL
ncbi:ROK family protein [Ruicaihuangia caeni]|uniref:ROK family protein n=1 Tax=Ruicaihuangia caeni TaxID=3042517 RepID=A0AAW6TAI4_9MICO|nr:ROK family protein [Klugiella sp. YN-L-19]MDI2099424.1 ROK family protein [Klugiella sp. YN-L-19]